MGDNNFNTAFHQRGLALITAMLVVAVAATMAAYLGLDQQIWQRQSENLTDRAQAEVVRAGALEWVITILAKDANESSSDDLTEDWAKKLPPIPVEGGVVTGQIIDAQSKFNLNNLVRNNQPSPPDIGTFQHLLKTLLLDPNLSDAVIDWIDSDSNARPAGAEDIDYLQMKTPYRAANQPLQSVEELRLIRGFTPENIEKLLPWVTALPQPTEINVNTAPQEVLAAVFYTLPASVVEQLYQQRPYKDQAKLTTKLQELTEGKTLPPVHMGVKSSYFEITIETLFGRYQRTTQALIQRGADKASLHTVWHSQRLPGWIVSPESKVGENPKNPDGGKL
ncbi:MAG TPA: type II secretion system minor pseudopilin GspK [Sulfuricaulis sp.]